MFSDFSVAEQQVKNLPLNIYSVIIIWCHRCYENGTQRRKKLNFPEYFKDYPISFTSLTIENWVLTKFQDVNQHFQLLRKINIKA